MQYTVSANAPHKISTDILLLFLFQDDKEKHSTFLRTGMFDQLNKVLNGRLVAFTTSESFKGGKNETISLFTQGEIVPTKVALVGLGRKKDFILNTLREATGKFAQVVEDKVTSLAVILPTISDSDISDEMLLHYIVEGIELGTYDFAEYKEKKEEKKHLESVLLVTEKQLNKSSLNKAIEKAMLYANATKLARDLVNEQSAIATPTYLAKLAMDIAKSSPHVSCKVFGKAEAEKMGMEAFLGIARAAGDTVPPKFIYLSYQPGTTPSSKKAKKKLAIVGKGITFDSGGINVKPGDHMSDMKMDMAGGAAVLGIFSVIEKIKPSFPVMGLIAATPNLISGSSLVPGDVVRAMNGKTIEVLNTDAEGRVTMADSLSFAVKEGATHIIDFATLTGAALIALGDEISAIFSNDRDFIEEVKSSAFSEGEKVWELPLEKEYKELNNSDVADIANIPRTRYGGTITAALFLESFVSDTPWIHFDIAGPAFANKKHSLGPKGGTGVGVRTVLDLLERSEK